MRKIFTLISSTIIFCTASLSQSISGTVTDKEQKKPVQFAVVALLKPVDSIIYRFTRTDGDGKYQLKGVNPGDYILMVTHPYYADLLDNINSNGDMHLPEVALLSKAKLLQEVIIKTGSPIKLRGDTTVYTADSFKVSANANVEELLRKLPGIQVDKDGTIKAMGATVEKVLVDGEEFFGDDPGMAVKNLRADAIKEVRVFDKKSEQSEFTGIDDGTRQKTIDLRLKEDKKFGYFGKIDMSGGLQKHIDDRFNNNILLSSFRGKRKISGYLLNGNTGQDRLNWQDEQKYGGGSENMMMDEEGGFIFFSGGGSDEEPYLDPQNGFLTNLNAGMNYNNKWGDKHTLNLSPKHNRQDYSNRKQTTSQTQLGDSILNGSSRDVTHIDRYNIKTRMTYDIKLDTNSSLKLTANYNFYHTENSETRTSATTGGTGTLKNTSTRDLQTGNDKNAFSGNLVFKHRFKKPRRTITATADWNTIDTEGRNYLKSLNQAYFNGIAAGVQNINQMKDYDLSTRNISGKLVYTEPLSKSYALEFGYQLSYNYGVNNQITYSYSPASGKYDFTVDSLSNEFRQNILQNIPSAKINFSNKKWKINVGSGFGFTNFELEDITYNKDYTREYVNFFPTANITYTIKPNHSVRFNYAGSTRQPTINQLQPLRNNNDYFNQYIGNPDLKPAFNNNFNVSYHSYNFLKDLFTYFGMNVRLTGNAITNNRMINLDSGKTIIQSINTDGNIGFNFWSGTGFKIKKLDLRFNINPNVNYNRYAEVINSVTSYSKIFNTGFSMSLSKSKEKRYDVNLHNNFGYNINNSSLNKTKIKYYVNTLMVNATAYADSVWALVSDYQWYSTPKTNFNPGLQTHILNAKLQRTFRKDEFTIYFTVRDILNQNKGINRNFFGNTYTEVINDRLKRYFLVGFTWNFKNKVTQPK